MFSDSGDLADVLQQLRRADEALTEFVAPLWPGVVLAAAWLEGKPRRYHLRDVPDQAGYYLLGTEGETARVLRAAADDEARRYRGFLPKASVILLTAGLAFPTSFAERLQGITAPWPIHFAEGEPLTKVQARFDGMNLLFEGARGGEASPLAGLFSGSSLFSPGELLGVPGTSDAGGEAEGTLEELQAHPEKADRYRVQAVLKASGAELVDFTRQPDGYGLRWSKHDDTHTVTLAHAAAPITSGICLPGARAFDPGALTRVLIGHALDAWQA